MTSQNKKRKCKNTLYSKGGEKDVPFSRSKHCSMFHKKDRNANKKIARKEMEDL